MRKRIIRTVIFALALAALFWMLDRIGWSEVGHSFRQVGLAGAGILMVMGFFESYFDGLSLRASIAGAGTLTGLRAFAYSSAGSVVNVFIPWDAGEVLKGALFRRHVSATQSISGIVLWNYFFKFTRPGVAVLAAVVGALAAAEVSARVSMVVLGASVAALIPYLVMRVAIRGGMAVLIVRLLRALRVVRGDATSLTEGARELDRTMQAFRAERPRDFAQVLLLQTAARLSSWITYWAAAHLMGLGYGFALVGTIYAALSVGSYVVMFVPARVGVTEGAAYVIFELMGLPGESGLLLALVMRVKGLLVNGLGAVYASLERPPAPSDPV